MKKSLLVLTIASINFSAMAEETTWLDSIKSFIGLTETSQNAEQSSQTTKTSQDISNAALNSSGLVEMLTSSLDVNNNQAEGGMGAIFNYVKSNVSLDDFTALSAAIPGVDGLISKMPTVTESGSSDSLSQVLDTASQYSDSVKSINEVKKQFDALGLSPEMIGKYISSTQNYLNSPQGQEAKALFTEGVNKLMG